MMARLWALAGTRHARTLLLVLNGAMAIAVFLAFRDPHGGDRWTYTALADGILHGNYSLWWTLPVEVPDTLRNPGYPAFLAAFRHFTHDAIPIQIAQLLLYSASVLLVLRIITRAGGGLTAQNIFLVLLLPSVNVAYYNTGFYAEPLTMFLLCAFVLVELNGELDVRRAIVLGLISGLAFQCRSTLLLFPIVWVATRWIMLRRAWRPGPVICMLVTFFLTTVPYSLWNLRHHGEYRPTPLEGGGGVLHIAWWSGRIPGHTEHWYWGNTCSVEMVRFVDPATVPDELAAFDTEWRGIDQRLKPLLTRTDSVMLAAHAAQNRLFRTFSTEYTLAREAELKAATVHRMKEKPGYTVAHMAYTAVRLWVTGIQMDRFDDASLRGKIAAVYPFVLTLLILVSALICVPLAWVRYPGIRAAWFPLILWLVYFAVVHTPFVIQARYTIPVRFFLIALIALSIERLRLGRPTVPRPENERSARPPVPGD